MIDKTSFYTIDVLDEPIHYEFSDGVKRVNYINTDLPVTLRSEYNNLDKIMRIERLKNCRRKQAFSFNSVQLLHNDRLSGMSIRDLARKYNKSTRTIQKYLKISPDTLN